MNTTDEARRLADLCEHLSRIADVYRHKEYRDAAAMLRAQADEIGRLNALAGPSGKSLGELERINDDLIADNERLTAERDALREALLRLKRLNDTGLYREEIVFEGSGRYAVDIDTVNEIGEVIDAALAAKEPSHG